MFDRPPPPLPLAQIESINNLGNLLPFKDKSRKTTSRKAAPIKLCFNPLSAHDSLKKLKSAFHINWKRDWNAFITYRIFAWKIQSLIIGVFFKRKMVTSHFLLENPIYLSEECAEYLSLTILFHAFIRDRTISWFYA